MSNAGFLLRQTRLRIGLTFREVARASEALSVAKESSDYYLPISRLAEIENHGAQPTFYRIYSLCTIYRLSFAAVLKWFNVDLGELAQDQERFQPKSVMSLTQLLAEEMHVESARRVVEPGESIAIRIAADPLRSRDGHSTTRQTPTRQTPTRQTLVLTSLIQGGNLPAWLLHRFTIADYRYGFMGLEDLTMAPIIPPGSILQIDMGRRHVEDGEWRNEHERPVYFIEHRDGYACGWCSLHAKQLILQPHPMSPCAPRVYHSPQDAEVIGQVVGVARSLVPINRSPRPSGADLQGSSSR